MPKLTLGDDDIRAGSRLLVALRRHRVPVHAAAWVRADDTGEYRLLIASGAVESRGEAPVRASVQAVLARDPGLSALAWSDVNVVAPTERVVARLERFAARNPAPGGRRVRQVFVEGRYVEDAFVYPHVLDA